MREIGEKRSRRRSQRDAAPLSSASRSRAVKALCAAVAVILAVGTMPAALATIEWPAAIQRFERMSPVETLSVDQGAVEGGDLELPESLRAVVPLDKGLDPAAFVQAEPTADTSDGSESYDYYWYGYVAPKNAEDLYEAGELAVYSILYAKVGADGEPVNEVGETAYRVYGSIGGGANSWFSCEEDGTITGQVVSVPVTWDTSNYQKDEPGTYTVEASFTGYAYSQARPFAKVTVEEKKECTCGAGNDAEGSAHAEDCPSSVQDEEVEGDEAVSEGGEASQAEAAEDAGGAAGEEPADDRPACACGAAEGERHAEGCAFYAEPAKDCHCAEDGGPIDADNFPWGHNEDCPNFSPVECLCREMVDVEVTDADEDGVVTGTHVEQWPGEYSHVHDGANVDCPLNGRDTVRVKKLVTGEETVMGKDDAELILAAQEKGERLYPALGEIEVVGDAGAGKAVEADEASEADGGFDPLGAIADFFAPEEAHASVNGGGANDSKQDSFMRSNTATSGNPDRETTETAGIKIPGSWYDYVNTLWMNKAYNKFAWTPAADTHAYNNWAWSGKTATQNTGTTKTNSLRTPTKSGTVWTVYSGEQLRYALENLASGDTVKLGGNIDLNGSKQNWATVNLNMKDLIIDGSGYSIFNIGLFTNDATLSGSVSSFVAVYTNLTVSECDFVSAKMVSNQSTPGIFRNRGATSVGYTAVAKLTNANVKDSLMYSTYMSTMVSPFGALQYHGLTGSAYANASVQMRQCGTMGNYLYGVDHVSGFALGMGNDQNPSNAHSVIENCLSVDNILCGIGGHSGGFASCIGENVMEVRQCFAANDTYGSVAVTGFTGFYKGSFDNCYATGRVEGYRKLAGFAFDREAGRSFDCCYSTVLVGLRAGGQEQGGFLVTQVPHTAGQKNMVSNCYAAGEVGNYDIDLDNPVDIGGFFSTGSNADDSVSSNCYYDKQTTAMREWVSGKDKQLAGVTGVLTTDTSDAGGHTVSGLTSQPGSQGFTGFSDDTQWYYQAEHYPQLNAFANATSSDWGTVERANLVRAYSKASTSTVFLNTWDEGYDWDDVGVRTKDVVSYDRELAATGKSDHKGNVLTYDTVREITTDAPVTSASSWVQMIQGGAPTDYDGDGTADGAAMDITGSGGIKIKSPGLDWWRIGETSGGQEGWRPIRLISYMDIDAGSDKTLKPGVIYDHRDDVSLTMMDKITDNLVVGLDDSRIWSTAKRGGYPDSPKFWAAPTDNMETGFSASKEAWIYTEIWRARQNPDGSYATDASGALVPDLSVKVTGEGTGANLTLSEQKWNGELPLYPDTSVERKYIVTYYWMLKDGRYRSDDKVITITPGDYEVKLDVKNVADDTPNGDSLHLGAAEDNALLDPGYTLSTGTLDSFSTASRVPYTNNSSTAWKVDRDTISVVKARLTFTAPDGEVMGDATVAGGLKVGSSITMPVKYYYNTYEYDSVQGANREVTNLQEVNVTYEVAQDAEGGLYLRYNKLANPPDDEIASALAGGDTTGIAPVDTGGSPTTAYINDTQYDVHLTLWVTEGIPFEFTKVDENGAAMAGARFELYACTHVHTRYCGADPANVGKTGPDANCNHYHKVSASGQIEPGDSHDETAANGSAANGCWDASAPICDVTTADDGLVRFDKLVTGDYMLVETATKDGYHLPHGQWLLRVDSVKNEVDVIARGETPPAFKVDPTTGAYSVANYPEWTLPFTGGAGTILLTVLGVVLVGGGICVLLLTRKKRR